MVDTRCLRCPKPQHGEYLSFSMAHLGLSQCTAPVLFCPPGACRDSGGTAFILNSLADFAFYCITCLFKRPKLLSSQIGAPRPMCHG